MSNVLYVEQDDALLVPADAVTALTVSERGALLVNADDTTSELLSILEPELVVVENIEADVLYGNNDVIQAVETQTKELVLLPSDSELQVIGIDSPNPYRWRWIDLVAHWSEAPVRLGLDIGGGDVWEYTYTDGSKLYRLIEENPYTDAFYRTWSGTTVSTLVMSRGVQPNT